MFTVSEWFGRIGAQFGLNVKRFAQRRGQAKWARGQRVGASGQARRGKLRFQLGQLGEIY